MICNGETATAQSSCSSSLRRRIRPLVLRRRKTEVAAELPAKQEQTIEVDLSPGHRKVYQRYLQR